MPTPIPHPDRLKKPVLKPTLLKCRTFDHFFKSGQVGQFDLTLLRSKSAIFVLLNLVEFFNSEVQKVPILALFRAFYPGCFARLNYYGHVFYLAEKRLKLQTSLVSKKGLSICAF